eukprot:SAG31_NODE_17762_length_658_cov_2.660107_1_plen_65_part_00
MFGGLVVEMSEPPCGIESALLYPSGGILFRPGEPRAGSESEIRLMRCTGAASQWVSGTVDVLTF